MGKREDVLNKEQWLKTLNMYINAIDYSVDINNLDEIQEKRDRFLVGFINKHDETRKYAEGLFKKAFLNGIDENIIDEFVDYSNLLLDNEQDKETNKKNIKYITKLIYKYKYYKEWKDSYIYDIEFLDLASIPIYLSFKFFDIVSGEILLYILHGNELIFRVKPMTCFGAIIKDDGEMLIDNNVKYCQKMWEDDRFFDSKTSYCKQLVDILNIDVSCYERKYLRGFLNIFGYIQENVGKLQMLKNFTLEWSGTNRFSRLDDQQKRILFFKTLLLQTLDFKKFCELFHYQEYLRKLISNCRLAAKINSFTYQSTSVEKIYKLKERFVELINELENYKAANKTEQNLKFKSLDKISLDDVCILVLWKLFDKEMLAFLDISHRALKLNLKKYTLEQKNAFFAMGPSKYIAVDDWCKFFYNNKEKLDKIFFRNENELCKIWNVARKFLAYYYYHYEQKASLTEISSDDRLALKEIFSKTDIFRNIDIITMMEIIIMAPNINVTKDWYDKNFKNRNKTLKQMIGNIERCYSPATIKWIWQYFLTFREKYLGLDGPYEIFDNIYEYYEDIIDNKDNPEKKEEGLLYYFKIQDQISRWLSHYPYKGEISNIFLAQYCCTRNKCYLECDYLFSGEKCNVLT